MLLAFFAFAGYFFVKFMVPETANKQIEEILEEILGYNYQANDSFMVTKDNQHQFEEENNFN